MINLFEPSLGLEELLAISQTFESKWIGKGERVDQFESDFANHLDVSPDNLVSTNSCTEALFQILGSLYLEDSEIIIPSIHFIGAANAIIANGGKPVFCDVDPITLNTSIEHIEPLITNKTRAIILLHYGGYPCDIQPIFELANKLGIWVIEDAACAIGAKYHGQSCGTLADFGVWSFDAMKTITCGDGGMIFSKRRLSYLKQSLYLGLDKQSGLSSDNLRWWEFTSSQPARRSIMNDISASIGIEQLKKLPKFLEHRKMITSIYSQYLGDLPLLPDCEPGYYFYWIQSPKRDEIALKLREQGVYTSFRYYPLYKALSINADLPNTEKAANETLLLPLHTGVTYYNAIRICEIINEIR